MQFLFAPPSALLLRLRVLCLSIWCAPCTICCLVKDSNSAFDVFFVTFLPGLPSSTFPYGVAPIARLTRLLVDSCAVIVKSDFISCPTSPVSCLLPRCGVLLTAQGDVWPRSLISPRINKQGRAKSSKFTNSSHYSRFLTYRVDRASSSIPLDADG